MDPHTGAILAAASVPATTPRTTPRSPATTSARSRTASFSDQYEPGSVMKIFTVTAALDLRAGHAQRRSSRTSSELEFWKYTVRNADHKSEGNLQVKDVIALSRNVATAKIARMLAPNSTQKAGPSALPTCGRRWAWPARTGVDIAGEASGTWYDPAVSQWAAGRPGQPRLRPGRLGHAAAAGPRHLHARQRRLPWCSRTSWPRARPPRSSPSACSRPRSARQAKDILAHVTGSVPWYAQGLAHPRLRDRRQDRHGPDLGLDARASGRSDASTTASSASSAAASRSTSSRCASRSPSRIKIEQGVIPLRIESYELFQMVARATIKQLEMKKSKDPRRRAAHHRYRGGQGARPGRNRQAVQAARRSEQAEGRRRPQAERGKSAKAGQGRSAKRSARPPAPIRRRSRPGPPDGAGRSGGRMGRRE